MTLPFYVKLDIQPVISIRIFHLEPDGYFPFRPFVMYS